MATETGLSRRSLLKIGAGCGAAAVGMSPLGASGALAAPRAGKGGRLIPAGKVGTITFTQRDVPGRLAIAAGSTTTGYLGGPTSCRPERQPDRLGPLVPLPGGWKELFEFLANAGFTQIEFAGYGQNAANPGGTAGYPATTTPPAGRPTSTTRAGCAALPRRQRPRGDRQPRLHPEHLERPRAAPVAPCRPTT